MKTGVLGGTFNPIHVGHLRAAEEVAEALGLERVCFVPSATPPHKESAEGELAPAELRLAWTRAAVADNPRFEVDPIEVERRGRSYSVETLQALVGRLAPERPVFLIGCDAFPLLDTWREPETLLRLVHWAVMTRPPAGDGSLADWLPHCARDAFALADDGRSAVHRSADTRLVLVSISGFDVSSSDIRQRIRAGRSVRYLVPESVREAVLESGVYTR